MQDEKSKAKNKLIIGFVFIGIILIFSLIKTNSDSTNENNTSNVNTTNETIKKTSDKTFEKAKSLLNSYNYEYKYNVTTSEIVINYSGKRMEEEELGYKEDSSGIRKYYINEDDIYEYINNEKTYISKIDYDNLEYPFLNLDKIKNYFNSDDYQNKKDVLYFYDNEYVIMVSVIDDNSINIEVYNSSVRYTIRLFNINNVSEL